MKMKDAVDVMKRGGREGAEMAGKVVDKCRFGLGVDYAGTLQMVRKHWPELEEADWDQLLYEADELATHG